jgi:hypothetical protein
MAGREEQSEGDAARSGRSSAQPGRPGCVPVLPDRADYGWTCAVAKREDDDGFLITAYPTDAIKEGIRVWPK